MAENFDDADWQQWRRQWDFHPGTIYFSHGAKGPPPRPVMDAWLEWIRRIDGNPMEFYTRSADEHMDAARRRLAEFVGCAPDDMTFMINTTMAIHAVATSFPLQAGDEVLLSNHDYGIVRKTWQRACDRAGARLVIRRLPLPIRSAEDVIEGYLGGVTERTKLLVFSHSASPLGAIFPAAEMCRRARQLHLPVCVDGAHGPGMLPLNIAALDCDFYAASCHKWLSAPAGSGFLYVHPRAQELIQPLVIDLGVSWHDVWWCGTRDFAPFLTVPAAIEFLEAVGPEAFRRRTHALARYARARVTELTGLEPLMPDTPDWYGSMASLPLPPGDVKPIHQTLWKRYGIEVPVDPWEDRNLIRISCHLYTTKEDIDRLVDALKELGVTRAGGSRRSDAADMES